MEEEFENVLKKIEKQRDRLIYRMAGEFVASAAVVGAIGCGINMLLMVL
jgi:hypothetical protein